MVTLFTSIRLVEDCQVVKLTSGLRVAGCQLQVVNYEFQVLEFEISKIM
jgi:hypothetical protein